MVQTPTLQNQSHTSIVPNEWLTPNELKKDYKLGNTRFWQLVRDGAFPVSRPKSPSGRNSRLIRIRRSDIEAFMASGYPTL